MQYCRNIVYYKWFILTHPTCTSKSLMSSPHCYKISALIHVSLGYATIVKENHFSFFFRFQFDHSLNPLSVNVNIWFDYVCVCVWVSLKERFLSERTKRLILQINFFPFIRFQSCIFMSKTSDKPILYSQFILNLNSVLHFSVYNKYLIWQLYYLCIRLCWHTVWWANKEKYVLWVNGGCMKA